MSICDGFVLQDSFVFDFAIGDVYTYNMVLNDGAVRFHMTLSGIDNNSLGSYDRVTLGSLDPNSIGDM